MPAKSKFIKIVLIIIVIVFVIIEFLYFSKKTGKELKRKDMMGNIANENVKFKNEKYGFEFKYPNYFNDIGIIDFDSLPKTIKESKEKLRLECEKQGEDCSSWGWARDASQEI